MVRHPAARPAVACALFGLLLCAALAAPARAADQGESAAASPDAIYVADFDIDAANVKTGEGLIPELQQRKGPLSGLRKLRPGAPKDPEELARELVDKMANQIVADLAQQGLAARRLPRGAPLPAQGWLLRGVFTSVDEGNRLRRAVVGFGAGETGMQVMAALASLAAGAPAPLYQLDTGAESRKLPGAAITMNPYVAAARFVMAGNDLDKNVKATAASIAKNVAEQVRK